MSDYENPNRFDSDDQADDEERIRRIQKRSNKISIFMILALIGGILVFNLISKQAVGKAGFTFTPEGMTIIDHDGNTTFMAFADVTEMVFVEEADYGIPVNGEIVGLMRNQWMQGVFRSDMFGKYIASCDPRVPSAIWFKTADMSYVISKESAETTQAIYDALLEYVPH